MRTNEKLIAQYSERANLRQERFHFFKRLSSTVCDVKPIKAELKKNVKKSGLSKDEFDQVKRSIDKSTNKRSPKLKIKRNWIQWVCIFFQWECLWSYESLLLKFRTIGFLLSLFWSCWAQTDRSPSEPSEKRNSPSVDIARDMQLDSEETIVRSCAKFRLDQN